MKVVKAVIALDSFKGSISSLSAGNSLAEGIKQADPNIETIVYSIADGGEGTIESLHFNCGGELKTLTVNDPLFRPVNAVYTILKDGTAVIEMAKASGLPLVEPDLRNPLNTTSYGTGELIKNALDLGAAKIILAIGGSATNDAGIGMLNALGINFLDHNNNPLSPIGRNLELIKSIDTSHAHPRLKECEFIVACDVDNPLYGEYGAAYIYGAQKGATQQDIELLDKGLRHFAETIKSSFALDIAHFKGSGAAGGMGAGLSAFAKTELKPGIEIILDQIDINNHLQNASIVFVGEGRLDSQTIRGKAPMGIAQRAKKFNIPVIALGGSIHNDPQELHKAGILAYFSIIDQPLSLEKAMSEEITKAGLKKQGRELLKIIQL